MIKKETIKKTRDFLNIVRSNLNSINRGHFGVSVIAEELGVSQGRFAAALDLGCFTVVGHRGKMPVYRAESAYFNEDIAAAVIRREYNRRPQCVPVDERGNKNTPPTPEAGDTHPSSSDILAIKVLKDNGYEGRVHRGSMIILL